jgi:mRNA interferase RelE/StbE
MKEIAVTPTAAKGLSKLDHQVRVRIGETIHRYAETGHGDVVALTGTSFRRLRVGDYRVILEEEATMIRILAVGHRREIYR